jgi:hypothetical protein
LVKENGHARPTEWRWRDGAWHSVLEGTDLEIAYNLQGDGLVLRVNKAGVQVFRVCLREAVPEMPD